MFMDFSFLMHGFLLLSLIFFIKKSAPIPGPFPIKNTCVYLDYIMNCGDTFSYTFYSSSSLSVSILGLLIIKALVS